MQSWAYMAKAMYVLLVTILHGHVQWAFELAFKIQKSLLFYAILEDSIDTTKRNWLILCRNIK